MGINVLSLMNEYSGAALQYGIDAGSAVAEGGGGDDIGGSGGWFWCRGVGWVEEWGRWKKLETWEKKISTDS